MEKPLLVKQQVSEKSSFIHRASLGYGKESSTSLVSFMYYIDYLVNSAKCLHLENLKKEVLLLQVCIRRESLHKRFKNPVCAALTTLHDATRREK